MASDSMPGNLLGRIAAGALLFFAMPALAANGFISGAKASRVGDLAVVSITFNCNVSYLAHAPADHGDRLLIQIEPTSICNGVSPQSALTRERHRPMSADLANILDIEYDGESASEAALWLNFADDVQFSVDSFSTANTVIVRVFLGEKNSAAAAAVATETPVNVPGGVSSGESRRVERSVPTLPDYVVNLQSTTRPPATGDIPDLELRPGLELTVAEARVNGTTWYRLRVGNFPSAESAAAAAAGFRNRYPDAWIAQAGNDAQKAATPFVPPPIAAANATVDLPADFSVDNMPAELSNLDSDTQSKLATLMADARRAMTGGELSRAVQIYTKVLQLETNPYQPEAQEFLALARERNGQQAHARAEYQRYLALYPDGDGAARVKQRLAAMTASAGAGPGANPASSRPATGSRQSSLWTVRTFFSQYYRRDANQLNDQDEVVSQSAIFSDLNVDARRRGSRFDLSTRLTAGYRYDFLDGNSDKDLRLSYAYADLADAELNLRGRVGRQSRNSGGVLGRFDGANLSYQATERLRLDTVVGKPVNSTSDGVDSERTFYGVSSTFGPLGDNLDLGVFFLQQNVEGMTDRQAVGAEVRYFGNNKSLWGLADYDTSFNELGSLFVQGSWRFPSELTLTGLFDTRKSPFLSMSNALVGQPIADFATLVETYTAEEIRQLALDRAAGSTTVTFGMSRPISPKLQVNVNATQSTIDATPESGGVAATPDSVYRYLSTDLVASSLLKEGDVTLLSLRYSETDSTDVYTVNIDTRYPFGSALRVNPSVRVDYREIRADLSTQWIYTPRLRLQYRADRRFRLEFETGMQFSNRQLTTIDEKRRSWFVNIGYQLFY